MKISRVSIKEQTAKFKQSLAQAESSFKDKPANKIIQNMKEEAKELKDWNKTGIVEEIMNKSRKQAQQYEEKVLTNEDLLANLEETASYEIVSSKASHKQGLLTEETQSFEVISSQNPSQKHDLLDNLEEVVSYNVASSKAEDEEDEADSDVEMGE